MSRKQIKTLTAFTLVVAALLTSATTVFATPTDPYSNNTNYEQGGIWSNVLTPYFYEPFGEVALPETGASESLVDVESEQATEALSQFVSSVINGSPKVVSGIFVSDLLAYPVIQQPSGSAAFVSTQEDVVTQFALAAQYGTVGILAHNYLAGLSFFNLSSGQDVYVVYGDGTTAHYVITAIRRYQALQPYSAYSEFVDLDSNTHYSSTDVFYEVYGSTDRLVLQTCIAAEGVDSWGRLFVIAELVA